MKYEAENTEENGADAYDSKEVPKIKRKVEGAVGDFFIKYNFQHTGWSSDELEDAQVHAPRQLLEEESMRVHKSFRNVRNDWAVLYPEVESFHDGDIDLMYLLPILIGKVYNQMIEEDKGETTSNYVFIPLKENTYKFQIGCLNAEIHNERMISVCNYVVTEGNTLLSDNNI